MAETTNIKISQIEVNKGQIEGLPKNPRFVKDEKFKKLVKSIEENPEMLGYRELLVYPHGGKYIVIGGNMRLRACKELGYKEVPCKVLPQDTTIEQLKAYTIKDNSGFGEWDFDLLANEWDVNDLSDWGLDLNFGEANDEDAKSETEKLSQMEYNTIYYQASRTDKDLAECVDQHKFQAKVEFINSLGLPAERKEILKLFAYRFLKIDFEAVADYYSFRATEDEKKAIERLRCVIIDNGQVGGFIEDDLIRITQLVTDIEDD